MVVRSIEINRSKKCYDLIKKRHMKREKQITSIEFETYLRKSDVSEYSKVSYGRFLRNGFHERYCYISKSG